MSEEFKRNLSNVALSRGLPSNATTRDLARHAHGELRRTIGQPSVPRISILPAPEDSQPTTIEARVSMDGQEYAMASVMEDGIERYKNKLRRDLSTTLVGELMRGGWIDVRIEEGEAIATLVVGGRNG